MAYYAPFYRPTPYEQIQTPQGMNQFNQQYQQQAIQQILGQPQEAIQQPTQTAMNGRLWVSGETGAKAYLVAPNNTVILWDSESPTIYIKSADMNGVPSMQIFDLTERTANTPKAPPEHVCKCGDTFVTREQFRALEGKYDELMGMIEELRTKSITKTTKATKESAE